MNLSTRSLLSTSLLLAVAAALVFVLYRRADRSRGLETEADRTAARQMALDWARLAPLPASAEDYLIATKASDLARSYEISFVAPPADIQKWLADSPGIRDVQPSNPSSDVQHYQIAPGGGATRAEVEISQSGRKATIRAEGP